MKRTLRVSTGGRNWRGLPATTASDSEIWEA
jgi:hypothetical protein